MKWYKKRELYLERIRPFIDSAIIKVLIGQRRVGKSYILLQLMDEIQEKLHVGEENIIYINKELRDFDHIQNAEELLNYVQEKIWTWKMYVFIDEIQDIADFEKALRDLMARDSYDIYISGSNARMLSSEIATYLTGRYVEFEIFPLNYGEFLEFHERKKSKDSFIEYMKFWWLPYLRHLELTETVVYDYIRSIYNTIVLRDIVQRYHVRNIDFLERLLIYMSDTLGSIHSSNNISTYLKSQKIKIGTNVVLEYLQHATSVYLINKVKRKDIVGKKIFEIKDKFYFSDIGVRNSLVWWYRQIDIGKILENIVFLHFKSYGYSIYVWENEGKEIDFIVSKNNQILYIQVCYLLSSEETIKREFWNLLGIDDNYEKIVLSMDEFPWGDYKWIQHYNIIDYLANFSENV